MQRSLITPRPGMRHAEMHRHLADAIGMVLAKSNRAHICERLATKKH